MIDTLGEGLELGAEALGRLRGETLVWVAALFTAAVLLGLGRRGGAAPRGVALAGFIALGIGLHNLGEGLVVGTALATGAAALATFLVVGFVIHNVTEGFGIAAPLTAARPKLVTFAGLASLAGLPAVLGVWAGGQAVSPHWAALCFGVGAGAILQVVIELAAWLIRESDGAAPHPRYRLWLRARARDHVRDGASRLRSGRHFAGGAGRAQSSGVEIRPAELSFTRCDTIRPRDSRSVASRMLSAILRQLEVGLRKDRKIGSAEFRTVSGVARSDHDLREVSAVRGHGAICHEVPVLVCVDYGAHDVLAVDGKRGHLLRSRSAWCVHLRSVQSPNADAMPINEQRVAIHRLGGALDHPWLRLGAGRGTRWQHRHRDAQQSAEPRADASRTGRAIANATFGARSGYSQATPSPSRSRPYAS